MTSKAIDLIELRKHFSAPRAPGELLIELSALERRYKGYFRTADWTELLDDVKATEDRLVERHKKWRSLILKHTVVMQAQAYEKLGRTADLLAAFEKRLALGTCRGHARSITLVEVADLYAKLGDGRAARRIMRRARRYAAAHSPTLLKYISRRLGELEANETAAG